MLREIEEFLLLLQQLNVWATDEGRSLGDVGQVHREINGALDELLAQDAFGTEGQNDPRGDRRG